MPNIPIDNMHKIIQIPDEYKDQIFFTSDTHFGHENILTLANRGFDNIKVMDAELIRRWNEKVPSNGIVFHLGDFAYKTSTTHIQKILDQLHGEIHLVLGNHDSIMPVWLLKKFQSYNGLLRIKIDKQLIVLCHYELKSWYHKQQASWHLFGHYHQSKDHMIPKNPEINSLLVNTETNNYTPYSYQEIEEKMNKNKLWHQTMKKCEREREENRKEWEDYCRTWRICPGNW